MVVLGGLSKVKVKEDTQKSMKRTYRRQKYVSHHGSYHQNLRKGPGEVAQQLRAQTALGELLLVAHSNL